MKRFRAEKVESAEILGCLLSQTFPVFEVSPRLAWRHNPGTECFLETLSDGRVPLTSCSSPLGSGTHLPSPTSVNGSDSHSILGKTCVITFSRNPNQSSAIRADSDQRVILRTRRWFTAQMENKTGYNNSAISLGLVVTGLWYVDLSNSERSKIRIILWTNSVIFFQ